MAVPGGRRRFFVTGRHPARRGGATGPRHARALLRADLHGGQRVPRCLQFLNEPAKILQNLKFAKFKILQNLKFANFKIFVSPEIVKVGTLSG